MNQKIIVGGGVAIVIILAVAIFFFINRENRIGQFGLRGGFDGNFSPEEFREQLDLPEDATDEEVRDAMREQRESGDFNGFNSRRGFQ